METCCSAGSQGALLSSAGVTLVHTLRFVLPLVLLVLIFSLFVRNYPEPAASFQAGVPRRGVRKRRVALASLAFSFYVDRFANYARLYGSLGGVVILLVWLYLTSVVLLVGSEINAVLCFKTNRDGAAPKKS